MRITDVQDRRSMEAMRLQHNKPAEQELHFRSAYMQGYEMVVPFWIQSSNYPGMSANVLLLWESAICFDVYRDGYSNVRLLKYEQPQFVNKGHHQPLL